MRRSRQATSCTPDGAVLPGSLLLAQKARQMSSDTGIGGIRQADLVECHPALPYGHLFTRDFRKEALQNDLFRVGNPQFRLYGSADDTGALAQDGNGLLSAWVYFVEEFFFSYSAVLPQCVELRGIKRLRFSRQRLCTAPRHADLHVVAA